MVRGRYVVVLAAAALGAAAAAFSWFWLSRSAVSLGPIVVPEVSAVTVRQAVDQARSHMHQPPGTVEAAITPHHLLAAPLIAGTLEGLRGRQEPRTIIIVGPDHRNAAVSQVVTTQRDWQTSLGLVRTDQRLIKALRQNGSVRVDDALLRTEHGVYTVIPFIRWYFPHAQIVSLALRGDTHGPQLERLAAVLHRQWRDGGLLLATVDFSHYRTAAGAWTDDQQSLPVIARGDAAAALALPVDSPPAISLVLRFAARRRLRYEQLEHANSAELLGDLTIPSTTSYLTAYFSR